MRELIISEWLSLDGIFDAASMAKWWMPFDSASRQTYIQQTINNCEVMLYGRRTYQMLFPYWSSFKNNKQGVADKLNGCKKYVVSSTLKTAPWQNTVIIGGGFVEEVKKIKSQAGGYILVQGSGSLAKPLLEAGLVDELRLLVNPAIIGGGERLFTAEITARLGEAKVQQFEKNVVLPTYYPGAA